jgi:DNA-binding NtrC family response regulator
MSVSESVLEPVETGVEPRDRQTAHILIVDDEEHVRFAMRETLEPLGYTCEEAGSGQQALEKFAPERFDLVLLDYRMPDGDGLFTLKEIRKLNSDVPILFVTAYGSKDLALQALREGAYDYFTKPFDIEEVRVVVRRALEKRLLRRRVQLLSRQMDSSLGFDQIIGSTAEMRDLFHLIQRVAGQDVTVLILGESGTGKELVASAIHRHSKRRSGPFVPINCAAIPSTLLESELFGHERGAFTGAHAQKLGKFEQAEGGTIFLDEIGDMDLMLQAKMLRVLQENEFQRVGGSQTVKTNVRIVAATNKDLSLEVSKGNFREDLYFRLNVIPLFLPPLRNRRADIPLLIEHFVKHANNLYSKHISGISPVVMEKFTNYKWAGNVRELENVITRAVILSQGAVITEADLPLDFNSVGIPGSNGHAASAGHDTSPSGSEKSNGSAGAVKAGSDLDAEPRDPAVFLEEIREGKSLQDIVEEEVQRIEKRIIAAALEKNRWRRGETANFLQISRRNLLRKMQKLGIE